MQHTSYCRLCPAACGVIVDVDDNDGSISITGDSEHALTRGFTCVKGRHLGSFVTDPNRLTTSRRRRADGGHEPVDIDTAIDEIASRLTDIIAEHGPDAVAFYSGTQASMASLTNPFAIAFWRTLNSTKNFSSMTVDQSAKWVTEARLGRWAAGGQRFADADVWMLVGTNPLISMQGGYFTGFPIHDGMRRLLAEKRRGLKLIVVDPRRTELATRADIHLQIIPGTDAALFAGIIRHILATRREDREFCERWAPGLDDLRVAVEPFTLELTAASCGVSIDDLTAAIDMFASGRIGMATAGTGPDMGPDANLAEHLIQTLNIVCGRLPRAGDPLAGVSVLGSGKPLPAEVLAPNRTWERGYKNRFGYGLLYGQLPVAVLADEITADGPDRVRALIVNGGNPAAALPGQDRVVEALGQLELLVTVDPFMSETAQLAHYVIAPVVHLERPDTTRAYETLMDVPFGQYTPAIVPRPDGVIDDWEFYLRLAWAMGRTMSVAGRDYPPGSPMPTTDEVLASFAARARVPLEEIRAAPHGKVFEELPPVHAAPESENASATFDVAPSDVVAEIAATAAALAQGDRRERPLLLIVRRAKNVMNSTGKQVAGLARDPQNPCHGHPDDLAELGLRAGQEIVIESDHGAIEAVIEADATLRRGVVSMSHSFGGLPGTDDDPKRFGSNINRILTMDSDIQPISAMPLMTAVPVTIRALVAAG